jgi:GNAT superfamily N-acetyltransferase
VALRAADIEIRDDLCCPCSDLVNENRRMPDPVIRQLESGDLDGAMALSSAAAWNQTAADWQMLCELAPGGCFAAVSAGRVVATAIGIDYGRFGWIAMMLVAPEHRGRGLGRRLLEAAMDALPPDYPIRLDATPMGRPLYLRYGFQDEDLLTRYVLDVSKPRQDDTTRQPVRRFASGDLGAVIELDTGAFRGRRSAVLEWVLAHGPSYARIMQSGAAGVAYCFGREGRLFDHVGPIVAATADDACALAAAAFPAAASRPIAVDAFDAHAGFTSWLAQRGFRAERPLMRMCLPRAGRDWINRGNSSPLTEFAILGPEFG